MHEKKGDRGLENSTASKEECGSGQERKLGEWDFRDKSICLYHMPLGWKILTKENWFKKIPIWSIFIHITQTTTMATPLSLHSVEVMDIDIRKKVQTTCYWASRKEKKPRILHTWPPLLTHLIRSQFSDQLPTRAQGSLQFYPISIRLHRKTHGSFVSQNKNEAPQTNDARGN